MKSEVLILAVKSSPQRTGSHLLLQPPASFPALTLPLPTLSVSLCFSPQELVNLAHIIFSHNFSLFFSQVFPCLTCPASLFFHPTNRYFKGHFLWGPFLENTKTELCVLYSFLLLSLIHCIALPSCWFMCQFPLLISMLPEGRNYVSVHLCTHGASL